MTSTYMERVHKAVDDPDWQKFRISMKGKSTEDKLQMLREYWYGLYHSTVASFGKDMVQIDIRVDNYIKALCRGGQLYPGESLDTALQLDWKLRIKS